MIFYKMAPELKNHLVVFHYKCLGKEFAWPGKTASNFDENRAMSLAANFEKFEKNWKISGGRPI